ncbi:hypothetical protein PIB30_047950 [Stylosanthes scabra]|uniref:Uncharacterized protein n=1 Tax=Stylosanthes scabra TaxID=79078 RepID=A0ABU6YE87_9FABA|nr:hypothetical protein [Stylosanthes scabra]
MNSRPVALAMPNVHGKTMQSEKSVTSPGSTNSTTAHCRLSAAEIKQRQDKGLCYYYDEKYSLGHKCKSSYLLLVGGEELEELMQGPPHPKVAEALPQSPHATELDSGVVEISFNAMYGETFTA